MGVRAVCVLLCRGCPVVEEGEVAEGGGGAIILIEVLS